MKKLSLKSAQDYLSRDEMRKISGGEEPETCIYYEGCPTGCLERYVAGGGGYQYRCNNCCVA